MAMDAQQRSQFVDAYTRLLITTWSSEEFANRLGSLIEAVNKLGSLFYGTILAIFLLAFYTKRVGGTAAFLGALIGEAAVAWCAIFTNLAWLWWNVIGCAVGVGAALLIQGVLKVSATEKFEVRSSN